MDMKLVKQDFHGDLSGFTYVYADLIAGVDIELKTKGLSPAHMM
jgi:hypothetical protein